MTFDDLWRLDPASEGESADANEVSDEFEVIDALASDHPFVDVENGEINRFLDWLEETS